MADPILTTASFCSGVAMLDEGVRAGCECLGYRTQPALLCEWEAYAAAVLLARMEDASLEPALIWCGDLRDFDGRAFRGLVDIATAGLPCQPYSSAGKQLGTADDRSYGDGEGPLPQFLRIVGEMQPAVVFLENVPPWVSGGWFRPFGEELSGLGYTIESPLFVTAEAVGASHKRERVFILAHALWGEWKSWPGRQRVFDSSKKLADSQRNGGRGNESGRRAKRRTAVGRGGEKLAESTQRGQRELRQPSRGDGQSYGSDETMGNAERSRTVACTAASGSRDSASESSRGIFAPGPNADWSDIPEALWPAIEPGFRVLVDGRELVVDAARADQLRCTGNGCVPLCAAVAFVELMRRVI